MKFLNVVLNVILILSIINMVFNKVNKSRGKIKSHSKNLKSKQNIMNFIGGNYKEQKNDVKNLMVTPLDNDRPNQDVLRNFMGHKNGHLINRNPGNHNENILVNRGYDYYSSLFGEENPNSHVQFVKPLSIY